MLLTKKGSDNKKGYWIEGETFCRFWTDKTRKNSFIEIKLELNLNLFDDRERMDLLALPSVDRSSLVALT